MTLSIKELKQQALARQQEADLKVQREAVEKQRAAALARANREQAQRQALERERQARIQAAARRKAEQAKLDRVKAAVTENEEGTVAPPPRAAASHTAFHAAAAKLLEQKQAPSRVAKIRSATARTPKGASRPSTMARAASPSEPREPREPRAPRSHHVYDKPDLTREEKRRLKLRRELMGGPSPAGSRAKRSGSDGISALARATKAPTPAPTKKPIRPKGLAPHPPPPAAMHNGINPADFLPGAPVRPEVLEAARRKAAAESATPKRSRNEEDAALAPSQKKSKTKPEPTAPPRKETPRERFIREEAERKARKAAEPERAEQSDEEGYDDEEDSGADSFIDDDEAEAQGELHKVLGMFRRGRAPVRYDEDDSDSDMEAGIMDVNREEMRSARLGRKEDEREQELEQRHVEEKARRKKMLETLKMRKR